ncbi:unnamed protein product [Staurois parvus]|uniref:Uncharacterized protein n=1 Tax=Staurois parvus TaxID=386267 RepID=A0ABN9DTE4_9NEOB|nr:unnamed protein product [Staurois parvus]
MCHFQVSLHWCCMAFHCCSCHPAPCASVICSRLPLFNLGLCMAFNLSCFCSATLPLDS